MVLTIRVNYHKICVYISLVCKASCPSLFFSSLRSVAGVAHRLHGKHGKNVVLLGEGCQAVRVGGYAHGIVFSAKELKADELFEVRNVQSNQFTQK